MVYRKRRARRKVGRGKIWNWIKSANSKLRKSKFLSTIGRAYGSTGLPFSGLANKGADMVVVWVLPVACARVVNPAASNSAAAVVNLIIRKKYIL